MNIYNIFRREKLSSVVQEVLEKSGARVYSLEEVRWRYPEAVSGWNPEMVYGFYEPKWDFVCINYDTCAATDTPADLVALHELIHWTGSRHRSGRDCIVNHQYGVASHPFDYQTEEVTAQLGMYMLAQALGIADSKALFLRDSYIRNFRFADMVKAERDAREAVALVLERAGKIAA